MRRFELLNSIGAVFDLMRQDAFFHAPNGLGKSREITSSRIGDCSLITEDKTSLSVPITGEMIFKDYPQYKEFIDFLTDTVTLAYCPDENDSEIIRKEIIDAVGLDDILVLSGRIEAEGIEDTININIEGAEVYTQGDCIIVDVMMDPIWYYRDCCVKKINKSEINKENRRLVCPTEFQPITPWYKPAQNYFSSADEVEGKKYGFKYPFAYADNNSGEITIINHSESDAPCKIIFYGPCENPTWSCAQNGMSITSGAVKAKAETGEYIVVDANPLSMEIAKYNASGLRTDLYQDSDFSRGRFVFAPPGESTLHIAHAGENSLESIIEVREYADTV